MSLGRFELEQDGDSSLRSLKVPRMEKGNNCLEKELHVVIRLFWCTSAAIYMSWVRIK